VAAPPERIGSPLLGANQSDLRITCIWIELGTDVTILSLPPFHRNLAGGRPLLLEIGIFLCDLAERSFKDRHTLFEFDMHPCLMFERHISRGIQVRGPQ